MIERPEAVRPAPDPDQRLGEILSAERTGAGLCEISVSFAFPPLSRVSWKLVQAVLSVVSVCMNLWLGFAVVTTELSLSPISRACTTPRRSLTLLSPDERVPR